MSNRAFLAAFAKPRALVLSAVAAVLFASIVACGGDDVAATPTTTPVATKSPTSSATPRSSATQTPAVTSTAQPSAIQVAASSKPRASAAVAAASTADLAALVDGNTDFAFDLYQKLRTEDGNLFYSPYSISLALAMTFAGARGQTEQQMAATLGFPMLQSKLHPAFNTLDQKLASLGDNVPADQGTGFELSIANSIWGQQGFPFENDFLDTLAVNYGAGMRLVDYVSAAEQARLLINGWVEGETKDRIEDLIPPGVIDSMTRLVLANAIYFKASWMHQFSTQATAPGQFTRLDGSDVTASMMHAGIRTGYADLDGVQAVELRYVGGDTSMLVLLPEDGKFDEFERSLDAARVQSLVDALGDYQVTLTMPKFEFESTVGLADVLKAMGITDAFNPGAADFSGMDGSATDLCIQDVLHKAFVKVDEEGTEAAAATAVIMGVTSMPQSATMTVDRPFVFVIRDGTSGTVLFVGRVLDPNAS